MSAPISTRRRTRLVRQLSIVAAFSFVAASCEYDPGAVLDRPDFSLCNGQVATIGVGWSEPGVIPAPYADPAGGSTYSGTAGDDVVVIANGPVTFNGLGGDDIICVNSTVLNTGGTIVVNAGSGNDEVYVKDNVTTYIDGGPGGDRIVGGAGFDTIVGGTGTDRCSNGETTVDCESVDDVVPNEIRAFVEAVYQQFLGRASDASGRAYWTGLITSAEGTVDCTTALASLVYNAGRGPEGLAYRATRTTTQLLESTYQVFLGRGSDAEGLAYWTGVVGDVGIDEVYDAFGSSFEYVDRSTELCRLLEAPEILVELAYNEFYGRAGDAGGRAYWTGLIRDTATLSACIAQVNVVQRFMLVAPEAITFQAGITPGELVDSAYRVIVGRESDPGGRAYWTGIATEQGSSLTPAGMVAMADGMHAGVEGQAVANAVCDGIDIPLDPPPPPPPGGLPGAHQGTYVIANGPGGCTISIEQTLKANLEAMLVAADADGRRLCGWGYRTAQSQINLRIAHCGSSNYAIYQMPSSQCSPPTARPGYSNHERGGAVDFYNGYSIGNPTSLSPLQFDWLADNAATYGFFNFPKERWHWSVDGR